MLSSLSTRIRWPAWLNKETFPLIKLASFNLIIKNCATGFGETEILELNVSSIDAQPSQFGNKKWFVKRIFSFLEN